MAVRNLERKGVLHDISFSVRAGEVVGIAGLLGSGRTDLLRCIFGLDPIDSGEVFIGGKRIAKPDPINLGDAVAKALAMSLDEREVMVGEGRKWARGMTLERFEKQLRKTLTTYCSREL